MCFLLGKNIIHRVFYINDMMIDNVQNCGTYIKISSLQNSVCKKV
jgi:hypothetical protein